MHVAPSSPLSLSRVLVYVALGVIGGALYAALNTTLDVLSAQGRSFGVLTAIHGVVDRGIPVLTGALLGVGIHYFHVRSALARAEALRAQSLHDRLHRVERDQAVWIVAAATLHEVNNPLHSLGLLLDELALLGPSEESTRAELLSSARANADRVRERLLSLKFAADGARPQTSSIALDAEVVQVVGEMEPLARLQRTTLSADQREPVHVQGDGLFLRIILENLLRNALDAVSGRDGHVEVQVRSEGADAVVQVSDDGDGITAEMAATLFEPLLSHKAQGLGLGLSIARALARSMGGDLSLSGRSGWSTNFLLRLPKEAT
ncbi:MAG TPA: HAMP domain-containing sensor histidine kinase [Polyangiaceae bacterium]|nr:HAMP domain-containing sensor histidine kinase [Polyangiaceae bacterium]